jgi:peptide/nickel transport system permease protein
LRVTDVFFLHPALLIILSSCESAIGDDSGHRRSVGCRRRAARTVLRSASATSPPAARAIGARTRIMRSISCPTPAPIIVGATLGVGGAIAESSLSFLGLGVQIPTPSWGNMLQILKHHVVAPWLTIFPGMRSSSPY